MCIFARWEGKAVAVKQFDLGTPGIWERAKTEIEAYERLKDCQGILIPKALFLSRSKYDVLFLGLQLGRMPRPDDDVSGWHEILEKLRRDCGFHHHDADGRNGIVIRDEKGVDRLVVIDLEESEFVSKKSKP